jgi:hypothetical protein
VVGQWPEPVAIRNNTFTNTTEGVCRHGYDPQGVRARVPLSR